LSARRLRGIFIQFIEEFDPSSSQLKGILKNDAVIIFILKLKNYPRISPFLSGEAPQFSMNLEFRY
jgi:hypothetical protein